MPMMIVGKWHDKNGRPIESTCFSAVELVLKPSDNGNIVATGNVFYSYRKNDHMVFGRRPIGHQRAARNRGTK